MELLCLRVAQRGYSALLTPPTAPVPRTGPSTSGAVPTPWRSSSTTMAMVWDDDRRAEVLPQRTREGDAVEFHFSLFLLMSEARTSLEIFDLAGRAVRQPEELPQRAGPQRLS